MITDKSPQAEVCATMKHVPRSVQAVFEALQFQNRRTQALCRLTEAEWNAALYYCDRMQLTLALARDRGEFPAWIRKRIDRNLADNAKRFERVKAAYIEISGALERAGIEFLVLKGFTQVPRFVPDVRGRIQYDIDLFCPQQCIYPARDEALRLGYEPMAGLKQIPLDHLPTMIRKTGWQWRGDYFDPEIPVSLELHYRLWDPQTERLSPEGLDDFADRREERELDDLRFTALHPVDAAGYAALHILRHLLRGDVRAGHVYELAWFLNGAQRDTAFWANWREWHPASLRSLETISFRLAAEWFGCGLNAAIRETSELLPQGVERWLARFAMAPVEAAFRSNKDELWLHLSLLPQKADKLAVARRKLLPLSMPGPVGDVHIPDTDLTPSIRVRKRLRYARFVASRVLYHARVLLPALWSGARWWLGAGSKRSRTSTSSF